MKYSDSLSANDCLYIVDRYVDSVPADIHKLSDYELILMSGCTGVTRISGNSREKLTDLDMSLAGPGVEISYTRDYQCHSAIRVVRVVLSHALFSRELLAKTLFNSIDRMLSAASSGIVFSREATLSVFGRIESLKNIESDFDRLVEFISILHTLSTSAAYKGFGSDTPEAEDTADRRDPRITEIQDFIAANFHRDLRMTELAAMAGFTPTAFSRFYKCQTGTSVSDFIIDVRLHHAAALLSDTDIPISDLCFQCGFNNISNFNRIFRKKRDCPPSEYRERFRMASVLC